MLQAAELCWEALAQRGTRKSPSLLLKAEEKPTLDIPVLQPSLTYTLDYPWFHLSPHCLSALVHSTYTLKPCCEKNIQFKRSSRGNKAILATCLLLQEADSKKKLSVTFQRGATPWNSSQTHSSIVLVSAEGKDASCSWPPNSPAATSNTPLLGGHVSHSQIHLPWASAELTVPCTKRLSLLVVVSHYSLVSEPWQRSSRTWSGHHNCSFTRERGGGVSCPFALQTQSNCGKLHEVTSQQFQPRDQICYWAEWVSLAALTKPSLPSFLPSPGFFIPSPQPYKLLWQTADSWPQKLSSLWQAVSYADCTQTCTGTRLPLHPPNEPALTATSTGIWT